MSEPIIIAPKGPPPGAMVEHAGRIIGGHLGKIVADRIGLVLG